MFEKRKAQGLSITTIIVAVIGLIILVVIIAILTGRMGIFSAGLESAASCENACKALGLVKSPFDTKTTCKSTAEIKYQQMPGKYSDVPEGEDNVCCCRRELKEEDVVGLI